MLRRVNTIPGRAQMSPNKLKAAIHARATVLAMDEETRRGLQERITGKASCKDMDEGELRRVLWTMNQVGGTRATGAKGATRSGRDERQPEELASIEQTRMISHLFDDLKISGVGLARMNFCRRVCGSSWPQTRSQANKVIEGLKAMRARGWKPQKAEG